MRNRLKIPLNGFKPNGCGAGHIFGELQTDVMEVLWQEPKLTVNDVENRLRRTRSIAHTTVSTTLDRMYRKGYLTRQKAGKAFVYAPRYSREQFGQSVAQQILEVLMGQFGESTLAAFVDLAGRNADMFERLKIMYHQKQLEQKLKRDK